MSNAAVPSRGGSLADLEVALEDVGTQKQQLPDPWVLAASTDLLEDRAALEEVGFVVALMAEEVEGASEEASKTEVASKVAVAEEELATKEAEASHPEVVTAAAEIVVGMEAQMDMLHLLLMLQLAQVAHVVVATAAAVVGIAEEDMEAPAPPIAMVLSCQRQRVGMIRVVAVAHMMTDPADIVATVVEAMEIATVPLVVEVVATWSR
jgi:hypothetical protein